MMAFDIYGEHLERGHCEVHPHVHEEYPCSICLNESSKRQEQDQKARDYARQAEKEYIAESLRGVGGDGI